MGSILNEYSDTDFGKYAAEREAILNGISVENEKLEYAKEQDNFTSFIYNKTDQVLADTDGDGKVSLIEYREYMSPNNKREYGYDTHHYYHLDYSFYIVFAMLCITAIIITALRRK